ncbi:MAG: hypothetical protein K9M10_03605 [Candidatus Pacebacteria bacterium]|nr:hypothetical protein [Candidatus Paceibacterota bacterium]MCF7857537.1 hypothetical protein [Candidatus Paceibacterota bacterium]
MKSLKIYLGIVSVLLVCAIGLGVYVWYIVQSVDKQLGSPTEQMLPVSGQGSDVSHQDAQLEITEPIIVNTSDLSSTQQKVLETVGYSQDTFTITPEMVACAKDALGSERLADIMGGATPSAIESIKLVPCLKS